MRTAINTCLTLLILMMIFLSSLAFASDAACPIGYDMGSRSWDGSIYGDRPYICFQTNRCKARPSDVSLCFTTDTTCVATFLTTGEQCTETESSQSGTIFPGGDIVTPPDNGGGDGNGGDDGGDGDIDSGGLAQSVPRYINWGTGGSSNLGRAFEALIYNNNQHSNADRDLYRTWSNRINNSINQSSTALRPDLYNINNSINQSNNKLDSINNNLSQQTSILNEMKNSDGSGGPIGGTDDLMSVIGRPSDMSTSPASLFDALGHLWSNLNSQGSTLHSINNNTSSMGSALDNLYGISASADSSSNSLRGILQILSDQQHSDDGINVQMYENMVLYLESAIKTQTDSISGSVSGLGSDIEGIKDALTTKFDERAFVGKVDFDVDGVLYKSSLYNNLFIEREQLEQEYEQLLDKVKNMFSLDTSQLNTGDYKDHILDFLAPDGSGRQFSFKSGVFPAFIQQANLIATILLFIAAVIAVRVIMGGSK
ncbi:hypothetical protein NM449_15570 [Vibrio metschnikovii]|uniref:hypothetical protein n=1 Tax=Vibrio metschnikovii TaxID=28172 RepID=UPI00315C5612